MSSEPLAAPPLPDRPRSAEELAQYARSLDCIHCGLCLNTCPTYRLSGSESSSPRGRIHLMRAVAEGRLEPDADFAEEMDFCLVCRHCESVCPAGVHFGAMMEFTRDAWIGGGHPAARGRLARLALRLGLGALARRRALGLSIGLLSLAQRSGLLRLVAPLLGERGRSIASLPPVPPRGQRRPLPARSPARGQRHEAVAMLEGCVMPELYGRVNRATAEVLAASGADVHCAAGHTCCGALHAHNGDLAGARALARTTIEAFDALRGEDGAPLPVVVNSAGCGAHLREYGALLEGDPAWRERAAAFAARVRDLSVHLAEPRRSERLRARLGEGPADEGPLTYDDPCHLCHGQQVRAEPRALLELLPGARIVALEDSESCCGSAGIYSVLRPRDSQEVLAPKLDALRRSGASVLVTANPGCQLQWESGVARAGQAVRVKHLAEVLAERLAPPAG